MKRRKFFFRAILLALIALVVLVPVTFIVIIACFFGDPIAHRVVILNIPSPQNQTNTTLAASDPQVQEAMQIIDQILRDNGLVRDTTVATVDQARGIIASYGPNDVLISGHELTVNFLEFYRRRSSPIVVKMCEVLKEKLAAKYGAQSVHIE